MMFHAYLVILAALLGVAIAAPASAQNLNSNDLLNLGLQVLRQMPSQQQSQPRVQEPQPRNQTQQRQNQSAPAQPRYDRDQVAETQRLLTLLGYDPGPIDGAMGRRTAAAIRDYERSLGLPVTGQPNRAVIVALRLDAERREATGTLPQPAMPAGPSFDCARAGTQTEFAICDDATLADLDATLARLYADRIAQDPASQNMLRAEQQAWLASRDSCGGSPPCLEASMRFRLAQLSAALAPGTDFAGGSAGSGSADGFARLPVPDPLGGAALSESFAAAAAPGSADPDLVLYGHLSSDLLRAATDEVAETGLLLTLAAVKARPELAEPDDAAFALMAAVAPQRLIDLLDGEGAAGQPQTEQFVSLFRSTGQPGQLMPVLQRLSPFAQSRVMEAVRAELPGLLAGIDTPALPVRVRVFCEIGFSAYDLEAETFPNPDWQADTAGCSKLALGTALRSDLTTVGKLTGMPKELRLAPAEAEALLTQLAPGGYDRYTMDRLLAVSYLAEIGPPEGAVGLQGLRGELPLREIGGWQLHLRSDLDQIIYRYPVTNSGLPGALTANGDGSYSIDGRTVLVFGQAGRTDGQDVGPFADPAIAQGLVAERAYFAALAETPDVFADPYQAVGMLVLFPEQDWPGILREAVPDKLDATLSKLGALVTTNRQPQQMMQTVAYALDLNEFETARMVAALRARLPDLIAQKAATGPIPLRVWCPVSFGPWDAATEVFPIAGGGCGPGQLNRLTPSGVNDQGETGPDGGLASLPRQLPAPIAEAEVLASALASPPGSDQRAGWMSYDMTLTGKGLDLGNGQMYPHFVWMVDGPFRLHTVAAPLETLRDLAVAQVDAPLSGEALRAAKLAGGVPWDVAQEADVADLVAIANGEVSKPPRVLVSVAAYPDAATLAAGAPVAVLRAASNQGRNLADVFGLPEGQILQLANLSPQEIDIGGVFALLPAPADAYAFPWPAEVSGARQAIVTMSLEVSDLWVEADQSYGNILVLEAVPVSAQVASTETPHDVVDVALAPVAAAEVATIAFAPGAWLATEVARMAGTDPEAFLIELAQTVESDPFRARDQAAAWQQSAAGMAPPDGAFWIAGELPLGSYDFATESFLPDSYARFRLPPVDGVETPLMQRVQFRLPDDALAVRMSPDEARAWQERTGLVGTTVIFRAKVRPAGMPDTDSARPTLRLDLLAMEVLTPGSAVTLLEPDNIVWRSDMPVLWASAPDAAEASLAVAEPAAPEPTIGPRATAVPALLANDVAGLTVGMSADAFQTAAQALFDGGSGIALSVANPDPTETWGTVTGFTDAGMGQTVLAVHPPGHPDGPVIALMRRLTLPPGAATPEALRLSLEGKYGPGPTDAENYALFWGLPDEPAAQMACAPFRSGAGRAPDMALAPGAAVEIGSSVSQPGIWGYVLSWPPDAEESGAIAAVDPSVMQSCATGITAMIREEAGGGLELTVWAFDMGAMARVLGDPAFGPPTVKPAEIKL